jgi:hypothetical protein
VRGRLIAESMRIGSWLELSGLELVAVSRNDVSAGTRVGEAPRDVDGAVEGQPPVWTFVDFAAPDERTDEVAQRLSEVLLAEGGWYADMDAGEDKIVVFAGTVFRYARGDAAGRERAREHGRRVGVPEHQLDWE